MQLASGRSLAPPDIRSLSFRGAEMAFDIPILDRETMQQGAGFSLSPNPGIPSAFGALQRQSKPDLCIVMRIC